MEPRRDLDPLLVVLELQPARRGPHPELVVLARLQEAVPRFNFPKEFVSEREPHANSL